MQPDLCLALGKVSGGNGAPPGREMFCTAVARIDKTQEKCKKGLGNGPRQTAVLWCPSDDGTMPLCDDRVIPAYTRMMPVPGTWLRREGWLGAQRA